MVLAWCPLPDVQIFMLNHTNQSGAKVKGFKRWSVLYALSWCLSHIQHNRALYFCSSNTIHFHFCCCFNIDFCSFLFLIYVRSLSHIIEFTFRFVNETQAKCMRSKNFGHCDFSATISTPLCRRNGNMKHDRRYNCHIRGMIRFNAEAKSQCQRFFAMEWKPFICYLFNICRISCDSFGFIWSQCSSMNAGYNLELEYYMMMILEFWRSVIQIKRKVNEPFHRDYEAFHLVYVFCRWVSINSTLEILT